MIKLTILYQEPADKAAFEMYYTANLALMERIPHVIRRQVNHVFGAPDGSPPYFRALELYFESRATMDLAMTSEAGVTAGTHLMGNAAQLATLFFSEVYEEAGGSTPGALPHHAREEDAAEADSPAGNPPDPALPGA